MGIIVTDEAAYKTYKDVRRGLRRYRSDSGFGGEDLATGRSEQEKDGNNGMRSSETQHAEILSS
jgi:hypothetical protein